MKNFSAFENGNAKVHKGNMLTVRWRIWAHEHDGTVVDVHF